MLKSKGSNGIQDQDDIVIIPLTTAQDLLVGHSGELSQIVLEATSAKAVDSANAEATAILTPNHSNTDGTAAFSILSQSSLLQTTSASNHTFTVLLAAVAAISLLVGGIGVMNIMLVTVTERTREIGIRKAIGARKTDILGQFLTEAVLLSILGGGHRRRRRARRRPVQDRRRSARDRAVLGRPRLRRRCRRRPLLRHLSRKPGRVAAPIEALRYE